LDGNKTWTVRKEDADVVLAEVKRLQTKYGDDYVSASRDMAGWFRANKAKSVFAHRRFHLIDKNGAYKEDDPTAPGGRHFDLVNPNTGKVIPLRNNRGWRFDQTTFNEWVKKGKISFVTQNSIMVRTYFHETDSTIPQSVFYQAARSASERLSKLLGNEIFPYPKDENVIKRFVEMSTERDSLVLDFFSGSATTAHAVMQLNAEDGGHRRFIMVQLPEPCSEDSEAAKAGYKNICEIGKERIRRAGKKIAEELAAKNAEIAKDNAQGELGLDNPDNPVNPVEKEIPDIGFRVLKLDSSSLLDVGVTTGEAAQETLALSRIREDRSPEDLLFQMLLETRIPLSDPIRTAKVGGNEVFFVGCDGEGAAATSGAPLVACLDPKAKMDTAFFLEIAKLKPEIAFFRDDAFADDSARTNLQQAFDQFSPGTSIKVI
jgi:adenine-specific DNA-methyltransferase